MDAIGVGPGRHADRSRCRWRPVGSVKPLLEACRLVAAAQGLKVSPPGESKVERTLNEQVLAIAAASRFRTRQVALRGDWWQHDQGSDSGHRRRHQQPCRAPAERAAQVRDTPSRPPANGGGSPRSSRRRSSRSATAFYQPAAAWKNGRARARAVRRPRHGARFQMAGAHGGCDRRVRRRDALPHRPDGGRRDSPGRPVAAGAARRGDVAHGARERRLQDRPEHRRRSHREPPRLRARVCGLGPAARPSVGIFPAVRRRRSGRARRRHQRDSRRHLARRRRRCARRRSARSPTSG